MMEGFVPQEIQAVDLNHMNMMAEMGRGISIARGRYYGDQKS